MSNVITVRVDDEVKKALDKLVKATKRTRSYLTAEALREYVVQQDWQVGEIEAGVAEANAGKIIAHEKVMKKLDEKLANRVDQRRRRKSA